jgi:hypothetical protein
MCVCVCVCVCMCVCVGTKDWNQGLMYAKHRLWYQDIRFLKYLLFISNSHLTASLIFIFAKYGNPTPKRKRQLIQFVHTLNNFGISILLMFANLIFKNSI